MVIEVAIELEFIKVRSFVHSCGVITKSYLQKLFTFLRQKIKISYRFHLHCIYFNLLIHISTYDNMIFQIVL